MTNRLKSDGEEIGVGLLQVLNLILKTCILVKQPVFRYARI